MKKGLKNALCAVTAATVALSTCYSDFAIVNAAEENVQSEIGQLEQQKALQQIVDELNESVSSKETIDENEDEIIEEASDETSEDDIDETAEDNAEDEEDLDEEGLDDEDSDEEDNSIKRTSKLKKYKSDDVDAVSSATMSKFSSTMNFQSAKSYGGLYEDKFEAAAYLIPEAGEEEGAFVAAGYTFGASDDPSWDFAVNMEASPQYGHSYNEAIVVRFDKDHAVDWVWECDRVGVSYFLTVEVVADGSIIAAGRCRDYESSRTALYLVKINPNDPTDYTEYIINSTSGAGQEFNSIVSTEDGGFAVTGYTSFLEGYFASKKSDEDSFSDKVQLWQNADGMDENMPKRASSKGFNGFLMKFDKDMNVEFVSFENYGTMENAVDPSYSSSAEKIYGIDIDANGDYVTVGYTALAKGNANAVISKWDGETGELISHRMAGTADATKKDSIDLIDAKYLAVAALSDGSYVVTGTATNDATTEEGWKCYGSTDVVVVRYSSDLSEVLFSRNIGTVDGLSGSLTTNNGTQMEGVKATNDGGYILFGTSNTTLVEKDLLDEGYTWDNYGSNDGILIKYDSNNNVSWCQNYGTTGGDWIYDVIFRENETEATVVGQTSGQYGTPAWEWHGQAASSSNPYDAFVMCTNMYSAAYTESKATSELSGIVWANGTYEGVGTGRGGQMTFSVVIENNKIASIECTKNSETPSIFEQATSLFSTIINKQSTDVDAVSGATMSSTGIKTGVTQALAKASAQTTINAITKIQNYTSANTSTTGNINNVLAAINYYTGLTDYEREYVTNADVLYSIAEIFGFDVNIEDKTTEETTEENVDESLDDTYWSLQQKYYKSINVNALLDSDITGAGVKIAVVDSGIIGNSKDLDYAHILAGWDYVNGLPMNDSTAENSESLIDTQAHGTFVAGIISAVRNNGTGIAGLLTEVDLVPIRIPSGTSAEASETVAQAIVDAVDKYDVDVITTSVSLADTDALKAAVEYAASKGVIVVGASGNSGVSGSMSDEYIYPASYDDVISVGAVDGNGIVRTSSTKNDQVFVVAPGQQILGLGLSAKGYRCYVKSGTSYSSPIVAAMAAAAKQMNPSITTDEFKELLKSTSQDKGDEGYDNAYGYGLVDMDAFVKAMTKATNSSNTSSSSVTNNSNGLQSAGSSTTSGTTKNTATEDATASVTSNDSQTATTSDATNNTQASRQTNSTQADVAEDETIVIDDEKTPTAADVVDEQSDSATDASNSGSESDYDNLESTDSGLPVSVILIIIGAAILALGAALIYTKKVRIHK